MGPQGPEGPQGPDGPPGPESLQVVRRTASQVVTLTPGYPDGPSDVTASCEPGEIAVSCGLIGFGVGEIEAELVAFGPSFDNGAWFFSWANTTEAPITISPTVVALCVAGELAGDETAATREAGIGRLKAC